MKFVEILNRLFTPPLAIWTFQPRGRARSTGPPWTGEPGGDRARRRRGPRRRRHSRGAPAHRGGTTGHEGPCRGHGRAAHGVGSGGGGRIHVMWARGWGRPCPDRWGPQLSGSGAMQRGLPSGTRMAAAVRGGRRACAAAGPRPKSGCVRRGEKMGRGRGGRPREEKNSFLFIKIDF